MEEKYLEVISSLIKRILKLGEIIEVLKNTIKAQEQEIKRLKGL